MSSKIVALCEGNIVGLETNRRELVADQSSLYLPPESNKYGYNFTITEHTMVAMAGADQSNADGHFVLWPTDPQATANQVRQYLRDRFGLSKVGVIISDSASIPLRRGAFGVAIAHSGFKAINDYVGQPDLFGRPFTFAQANISGGLAAAAVLAMGEGSESTPLCAISDLELVEFQDRDPSQAELDYLHLSIDDDLFAPFLTKADWLKGKKYTP